MDINNGLLFGWNFINSVFFKKEKTIKFYFFKFLDVSNITGVAINSEEYVPTKTPTIKANIKPLIASPPKMKIANKQQALLMKY